MEILKKLILVCLAGIALLAFCHYYPNQDVQSDLQPISESAAYKLKQEFDKLPKDAVKERNELLKKYSNHLFFEKNEGQFINEVRYQVQTEAYTIRFLENSLSVITPFAGDSSLVWNMQFENINKNVSPRGVSPQSVKLNRHIAEQDKYTDIPNFEEVWYDDIYPGIDLRFYAKNNNEIEYDFIVHPGAKVEDISIHLQGIDGISRSEQEELLMDTPLGQLKKGAPYSYQMINGEEVAINSYYDLNTATNSYAFHVDDFDEHYPLIIDPTTLLASVLTLDNTNTRDIAVGPLGVYLTGKKYNNNNVPITVGVVGTTYTNLYIYQFSLDMSSVVMATYIPFVVHSIGGSTNIIELDASNNIYLYGSAYQGSQLVTVNGFASTALGNNGGLFIMKLNPSATNIEYSTHLNYPDTKLSAYGLDIYNGLIYLIGEIRGIPDTSNNFNTVGSLEPSLNPNLTATDLFSFFVVIDPAASGYNSIKYATYLSTNDKSNNILSARGLKVNPADGTIWISGSTNNTNFYLTPDHLFDYAPVTYGAAFLLQFNSLPNLGNGLSDILYASGMQDNNYQSNTFSLDIKGDYLYALTYNAQLLLNSTYINYHISKIDVTTKQIINQIDVPNTAAQTDLILPKGLRVDDCGTVYVSGYTQYFPIELPNDAYQFEEVGRDAFLLRYSSDLSELIQGTYLGGDGPERVYHEPEIYDGAVYIGGWKPSSDNDIHYPIYPGIYYQPQATQQHGFVAGFSTLYQANGFDTICANSIETIDAPYVCGGNTPYTYSWTALDPGNVSSITNSNTGTPSMNLTANTTFVVKLEDAKGTIEIDTVFIEVIPTNSSINLPNKHICSGSETTIGEFNYSSHSYNWSIISGDNTSLNGKNTTVGILTVSPNQTTTYNVNITDCQNTSIDHTVIVYVDEDPANIIDAGPDDTACAGTPITIGLSKLDLDQFSYSWSPSAPFVDPTIPNPTINSFKGSYVGVYTLTMTNLCTGASATDDVFVDINNSSADAKNDTLGCINVPITLSSRQNPLYNSYSWTFAATGTTSYPSSGGTITNNLTPAPTIVFSSTGEYDVVLTTSSTDCGVTSDTINIIIEQLPVAFAGIDKEVCVENLTLPLVYKSSTIGLDPIGNYTYTWKRLDGNPFNTGEIDQTNISSPTINANNWGASASMSYVLEVMNLCGNTDADTITLTKASNIPTADAYQSNPPNLPNEVTLTCSASWPIGMDPEPGIAYSWSPTTNLSPYTALFNDINQSVVWANTIVDTIVYTLTAVDTCSGQVATSTITFNPVCGGNGAVIPPTYSNSIPVADAGPDRIKLCYGNTQKIGTPDISQGIWTYQWFPSTGLDSANIAEPTFIGNTTQVYTLVVTNPNTGLQASDVILVAVYNSPIANAGPDITVNCVNNLDTLLGTPAGSNPNLVYSWQPTIGLNNPNIAQPTLVGPHVASQYELTVKDLSTNLGCTSNSLVNINITSNIANAGPDAQICPGNSVQIGIFGTPGFFSTWSPPAGLNDVNAYQPIASPTETTTYYLSIMDATGCVDIDEVTVSVTPTTTLPASVEDVYAALCTNSPSFQIGLNAQETGATYVWTANPSSAINALSSTTIAQPTVNPSLLSGGNDYEYTLEVTDVATGCTSTGTVLIKMSPVTPPTISIANANISGCAGDFHTLSSLSVTPLSPNYTYAWTSTTDPTLEYLYPPSSPNPVVEIAQIAHTYTLVVTNTCTNATASQNITVTPTSNHDIIDMGTYAPVCAGTPISITPTVSQGSGATYNWKNYGAGGTFSNSNTLNTVFTPNTSTFIYLTMSKNGCDIKGQIFIEVIEPPAFAGNDINVCSNDTVTIGSSGDPSKYNYTWSVVVGDATSIHTPNNTPQVQVSPTITTTYRVTVSAIGYSCPSTTDEITVSIGAICNNATYLDRSGWSIAYTDSEENNYPATNAIDGNDSTMWHTEFIYTVPSLPHEIVIDMGSVQSFEGLSYLASHIWKSKDFELYTSNTNGNWGTPITTDILSTTNDEQLFYFPQASGRYLRVRVTSGYNTNSYTTLNELNVLTCEGPDFPDESTCTLKPISIGGAADPNYSYAWSPTSGLSNPNISNPVATVSTTTTYTVTVTNDCNGSTKTDDVTITVLPAPVVNAGPDVRICGQNDFQLIGDTDQGHTYSWIPTTGIGSPQSSSTYVSMPTNATSSYTTTYILTATAANGCVSDDIVLVTFEPTPTLNYEDLTICPDESSTVIGDPNSISGPNQQNLQIVWLPNSNINDNRIKNPTVSPTETTIYTITATTQNGCTQTQSVEISVPEYSIEVNDVAACTTTNGGGTAVISAPLIPNALYSWTGPNSFYSNTRVNNLTNLQAADFGDYIVTVITDNGDGCVLKDTLELIEICDIIKDCDLTVSNSTLLNCVDTSQVSLSTEISWNNTQYTVDDLIQVLSGGQSFTIDPNTTSSPVTLTLSLPKGGNHNIFAQVSPQNICTAIGTVDIPEDPCDWGDLPDLSSNQTTGDYQTLFANNGPSHLVSSELYIDASVDGESDGQPSATAQGDGNDEDGFTELDNTLLNSVDDIILPLSIHNTTGITAYLDMWIDWNRDGDFDDANETVFHLADNGAGNFGTSSYTVAIPSGTVTDEYIAVRTRLSHNSSMTPYGNLSIGEVEDYYFTLKDCPIESTPQIIINMN